MRVLVTGSEGYIGTVLTPFLMAHGHEVVGVDTGFHRVGWLYNGVDRSPAWIEKDIRQLTADDLRGFDAIVHLAELSNDPVGQLNPDITFEINHHGSVRLATLAREVGVERFIYMSSCSVYGAAGDSFSTETSEVHPLTAYAQCKVLVERDVRPMADDGFSPTFLRNATAFGASPRQRFDLVVNDLAGHAWTEQVIRMDSDGRPWRPFVHILDISRAIMSVLAAPRDIIHGEIFNVGTNEQNYQIREIAEIISSTFPDCSAEHRRQHRRRSQLQGQLRQDPRAPARFRVPLRRRSWGAAAPRCLPRRADDDRALRVPRPHPDQADPASPGDAPDRRPFLLAGPARCRLPRGSAGR